jgi:hypothetical protein
MVGLACVLLHGVIGVAGEAAETARRAYPGASGMRLYRAVQRWGISPHGRTGWYLSRPSPCSCVCARRLPIALRRPRRATMAATANWRPDVPQSSTRCPSDRSLVEAESIGVGAAHEWKFSECPNRTDSGSSAAGRLRKPTSGRTATLHSATGSWLSCPGHRRADPRLRGAARISGHGMGFERSPGHYVHLGSAAVVSHCSPWGTCFPLSAALRPDRISVSGAATHLRMAFDEAPGSKTRGIRRRVTMVGAS